ncbi:hypothetical protein QAD02_021630 [Eretmocerus hayati]|uniref:Uncharacterized protein n=1 Tax=Eretmocerus hayati TaxID=131215 RepID=A0ACC2PQZ3_9HYME|nr:hypothetical protein QAD02_021630 [Eretmocerus hayati]
MDLAIREINGVLAVESDYFPEKKAAALWGSSDKLEIMQSTTGVRPKQVGKAEDFPEHYDEFEILKINAESSRLDVPKNSHKNQRSAKNSLESAAHHSAGDTDFTLTDDPWPLVDI